METTLSLKEKTVTIGPDHPFVVIVERINPTRRKKLAQSLAEGDFRLVQEEAKIQVEAGAQVLDVNAGVPGADEPVMLTGAVKAIMDVVSIPLCFDSANPKALAAALEIYPGKALIRAQPVERQHDRVQEGPHRVRRPRLPAGHAGGQPHDHVNRVADRLRDRARHAARGHGARLRPRT